MTTSIFSFEERAAISEAYGKIASHDNPSSTITNTLNLKNIYDNIDFNSEEFKRILSNCKRYGISIDEMIDEPYLPYLLFSKGKRKFKLYINMPYDWYAFFDIVCSVAGYYDGPNIFISSGIDGLRGRKHDSYHDSYLDFRDCFDVLDGGGCEVKWRNISESVETKTQEGLLYKGKFTPSTELNVTEGNYTYNG